MAENHDATATVPGEPAKKPGHTPGPWHTGRNEGHYVSTYSGPSIFGGDDKLPMMVAEVLGGNIHTDADARLITAAPDLLTAAKRLSAVQDGIYASMSNGEAERLRAAWADMDAAIAKAEGGAA